jgi:Predicted membrane protein
MEITKKAKTFINIIIKNIRRPEMRILSGQLAFYFVLMLAPILALFGNIISFFNLSGELVGSVLIEHLPKEIGDLIVHLSRSSGLQASNTLFIILTLFLASNGTYSMIVASNSIYKVKSHGYLKDRVKAVVMLLYLLLLFIIMFLLPGFGNKLFGIITAVADIEVGPFMVFAFESAKLLVSFLLIFLLVKILYIMAPDTKIKSKHSNYGALFTSIVWIIATVVFASYVGNFASYATFYSSLSNIIILMLWMYILAYVFVLGMSLNASIYEVEKEKPN